jgi:hypothetical protein
MGLSDMFSEGKAARVLVRQIYFGKRNKNLGP